MVDWRSARSPANRPESGSALTVSDPLKGTRNESLRTVRNPRTTYPISRMSILLCGLARVSSPPALPVRAIAPMAGASVSHSAIVTTIDVR